MHDDGECLKLLNTYLGECLRQCVILKRRQREPGCVRERKRERGSVGERERIKKLDRSRFEVKRVILSIFLFLLFFRKNYLLNVEWEKSRKMEFDFFLFLILFCNKVESKWLLSFRLILETEIETFAFWALKILSHIFVCLLKQQNSILQRRRGVGGAISQKQIVGKKNNKKSFFGSKLFKSGVVLPFLPLMSCYSNLPQLRRVKEGKLQGLNNSLHVGKLPFQKYEINVTFSNAFSCFSLATVLDGVQSVYVYQFFVVFVLEYFLFWTNNFYSVYSVYFLCIILKYLRIWSVVYVIKKFSLARYGIFQVV